MFSGSHVIVYSRDADADRAFFRDVLKMPATDAGEGWLIFALPPAEVAFHPADENGAHELYLMCDDLAATMEELEEHDVHCDEPSELGLGDSDEVSAPRGRPYQPLPAEAPHSNLVERAATERLRPAHSQSRIGRARWSLAIAGNRTTSPIPSRTATITP